MSSEKGKRLETIEMILSLLSNLFYLYYLTQWFLQGMHLSNGSALTVTPSSRQISTHRDRGFQMSCACLALFKVGDVPWVLWEGNKHLVSNHTACTSMAMALLYVIIKQGQMTKQKILIDCTQNHSMNKSWRQRLWLWLLLSRSTSWDFTKHAGSVVTDFRFCSPDKECPPAVRNKQTKIIDVSNDTYQKQKIFGQSWKVVWSSMGLEERSHE